MKTLITTLISGLLLSSQAFGQNTVTLDPMGDAAIGGRPITHGSGNITYEGDKIYSGKTAEHNYASIKLDTVHLPGFYDSFDLYVSSGTTGTGEGQTPIPPGKRLVLKSFPNSDQTGHLFVNAYSDSYGTRFEISGPFEKVEGVQGVIRINLPQEFSDIYQFNKAIEASNLFHLSACTSEKDCYLEVNTHYNPYPQVPNGRFNTFCSVEQQTADGSKYVVNKLVIAGTCPK